MVNESVDVKTIEQAKCEWLDATGKLLYEYCTILRLCVDFLLPYSLEELSQLYSYERRRSPCVSSPFTATFLQVCSASVYFGCCDTYLVFYLFIYFCCCLGYLF